MAEAETRASVVDSLLRGDQAAAALEQGGQVGVSIMSNIRAHCAERAASHEAQLKRSGRLARACTGAAIALSLVSALCSIPVLQGIHDAIGSSVVVVPGLTTASAVAAAANAVAGFCTAAGAAFGLHEAVRAHERLAVQYRELVRDVEQELALESIGRPQYQPAEAFKVFGDRVDRLEAQHLTRGSSAA